MACIYIAKLAVTNIHTLNAWTHTVMVQHQEQILVQRLARAVMPGSVYRPQYTEVLTAGARNHTTDLPVSGWLNPQSHSRRCIFYLYFCSWTLFFFTKWFTNCLTSLSEIRSETTAAVIPIRRNERRQQRAGASSLSENVSLGTLLLLWFPGEPLHGH